MSLRSSLVTTSTRASLASQSFKVRTYEKRLSVVTHTSSSMSNVATKTERAMSGATASPKPTSQPHVVVSSVDQRVLTDPPNGLAWLESMPRGAYTTARTTESGRCVFELGFHLQRLVDSARLMALHVEGDDDSTSKHNGNHGNSTILKQRILDTVRRGVEAYMRQHGGYDDVADEPGTDDHEMKITVLVCDVHDEVGEGGERADIHVHVSPLGPRKAPGPVRVEIRGAPRTNAAAKDSEWVTERKKLAKPDDVNELVLEANGALYEGLSSNFFALMDGTLYTAGENVLLGSVRESVLRQAAALDIPVVLDPPRIDDVSRWEAAFVSSTSRMLLPIDELLVRRGNGGDEDGRAEGKRDGHEEIKRTFDYSPDALARVLEAAVKADILSSSERIF